MISACRKRPDRPASRFFVGRLLIERFDHSINTDRPRFIFSSCRYPYIQKSVLLNGLSDEDLDEQTHTCYLLFCGRSVNLMLIVTVFPFIYTGFGSWVSWQSTQNTKIGHLIHILLQSGSSIAAAETPLRNPEAWPLAIRRR